MRTFHMILSSLLVLSFVNTAFADDTTDAEYGNQDANYDNQGAYRDQGQDAAAVDPWSVPSPNMDDSEMLQDQMNPWPTEEDNQNLYD